MQYYCAIFQLLAVKSRSDYIRCRKLEKTARYRAEIISLRLNCLINISQVALHVSQLF